MKKATIRGFLLALTGIFLTSTIWAQNPRLSPAATSSGNVKGVTITIDYSSPGVKGRKIWGDLVPYDKVWRAGANEATLIATDKDIHVEGKPLPAGKYSLYAIPGEKEWIIIINSATGQWGINRDGTTTEDPAKDVLRVTVKPVNCPEFNERLIYMVDVNGFSLFWENLRIPVSIN
jgi:DUF2911 family protein